MKFEIDDIQRVKLIVNVHAGMRLRIELIKELVLRGGGYGLFTGCTAGDTGAAIALRVDVD